MATRTLDGRALDASSSSSSSNSASSRGWLSPTRAYPLTLSSAKDVTYALLDVLVKGGLAFYTFYDEHE